MIKILNLLLGLILISCASTTTTVDTDDLYFSKRIIDTSFVKKQSITYINRNYYPIYNDYYWSRGYTPRYIIVQPVEKVNYGKRPSREGNYVSPSINRRRGR